MLESATSLERSGSLKEAHKCYVDAVNILKSIWSLEGTGMSGEARERFILYLRQVDAKAAQLKQRLPPEVAPASIAVLRPANSLLDTAGALSSTSPPPAAAVKVSTTTSPTTATPPVPTQAPKVGGTPKHQDPVKAPPSKNDDLLPSLPDFPRNLPPPAKVTVAKAPPAKAATPTTEKPDPAPVSTVPPPAPPSSVAPVSAASSFAPRTSNVVMHAIELSIKLSKERKYKQAIDVLQHAYDAGRGEGNNPANFSKIQEMVVELRKRYYEVFKPRFFQDNAVTKDEMEILRKSGQTTTILLPIWDDVSEGYAAENVYLPCKGENWEDAFAPFISLKQKSSGCVLARYPKIVSAPETLKVYYEADPMNIKQTVVGDCSLVSSLIICTNFQKRFPQYNLISGVVFPQDENGAPMVSPKGKYCVKMLVNGITRMVVVDDRIPVSKTMKTPPPPSPTSPTPPTTLPSTPTTAAAGGGSGEVTAAQAAAACRFLFQPLCTYSRNPAEMWVSIIEKAFVKVCGGSYDFPGSNSSVDMFKLSGWLPDGYYFDGEGVDLELQWKRLSVSHGRGAVLTTISTPQNLTKDVEEKLKLVPGHAYAVIGVLEEDGRRLLKIKNPWARQSWEGLYSFRDTNWPPELKEKLGFHEIEANQGVFWMSWADVCRYFKRCNLSWNPYLLFQPIADNTPKKPRRLAAHGVLTWTDCFAECPQYHVMARQLSKPTRLHVVLARHVLNLVKEYEQRSDAVDDDSPLITVHVFDVTNSPTVAQLSAGRQGTYLPNCEGNSCMARLISNGGELLGGDDVCRIHQGVYKNIEAQTISFTCPAGDRDLVLVVAQHQGKKESKFPFSLFLHTEISAIGGGNSPSLTMHLIPAFKPCGEDNKSGNSLRSVTQGAWKAGQSCGGKSDAQTFVFNPQYELTLTAPSHLTIRLNAGENKEAINVQVVRRRQGTSSGGRATSSPEVPWAHRVDCIHPRNCEGDQRASGATAPRY
ncbi:calpain-like cysteine peptidase, putative [Bodo saltans]|uniref:Calpain-like cysteine peptidase, putative n=1 Tax=Bodo saltans TaxID=75058 RepID=A0A0S4IXC5_BODSA|nr:calpain-like cysteine peptidase, putative [Bodo saltans]|eukprot:CUG06322.1 calpain-like cysteine peptidase, putative [Bodo saltans]